MISKWEFQTDDSKCHIIHKYEEDEVKKLQSEGHFPDSIKLIEEEDFEDNFTFSNEISDEEKNLTSEEEEDIDLDDI